MIPANTRIWIVAGVTDLRRGFPGLSGLVQTKLAEDPLSGHVFCFRGRRGDMVKLLWHDGDGLLLAAATTCLLVRIAEQSGPPSSIV